MNIETQQHKIPLGSIVKVKLDLSRPITEEGIEINLKGNGTLYVVGHSTDGSGAPLYAISDLPVIFPVAIVPFNKTQMLYRSLATLVEYFFEDEIEPIGQQRELYATTEDWIYERKISHA
jgi:hypothetical protein